MGVLKRSSISLALVMTLCANSANASMSDFIQKALNASVTETETGYYKSQVSGYATLGGARVRWGGLDNISPINVQAPNINIGCSGIDMVFGGFSYLNFEYLVEKLKKISTAAPAFAFKLALSTLCKDCDTIMTALEDISNTINSINFDSCQALSNWSDRAGEALSGVGLTGVDGGQAGSWLEGMNDGLSSWVSDANTFINGQGGSSNSDGTTNTDQAFSQGSLLQRAMKSSDTAFSKLMGKDNYEKILRALYGDIVGYVPKKKDVGSGADNVIPEMMYLSPTITAEEFVNALIGSKNQDSNTPQTEFIVADWDIAKDGDFYREPKYKGNIKIPLDTYYGRIKEQIKGIIEKGHNNQTLDQADITLISSFKMATQHFIYTAASHPEFYTDPYIEVLAVHAFDNLMQSLTNSMSRDIRIALAQDKIVNKTENKEILIYFHNYIRQATVEITTTLMNQMQQKDELLKANQHFEFLYQQYVNKTQSAN